MKQAFLWLIVILGLVGLLTLASARADEARTSRLYARAHLVEAQSSSRQYLLAGLMPYTIIAVSIIGGTIAIVALVAGVVAVVAVWPRSPVAPGRVIEIETRTIILLQPGQSRRELWRALSGADEVTLRGRR